MEKFPPSVQKQSVEDKAKTSRMVRNKDAIYRYGKLADVSGLWPLENELMAILGQVSKEKQVARV